MSNSLTQATASAVGPLVATYAASYLPGDPMVKTLIASQLGSTFVRPFVQVLSDTHLWRWIGLGKSNVVVISPETALYDKVERYLLERFVENFERCELKTQRGGISFAIANGLLSRRMEEEYEGAQIFVELAQSNVGNSQEQVQVSEQRAIHVCSKKATYEVLRAYVKHICEQYDRSQSRTLTVYRSVLGVKKKRKRGDSDDAPQVYWDAIDIRTNRNFGNTIVSASVQRELLDDIARFMGDEQWYHEKGIPYKRGYVLHGPPGTGKVRDGINRLDQPDQGDRQRVRAARLCGGPLDPREQLAAARARDRN